MGVRMGGSQKEGEKGERQLGIPPSSSSSRPICGKAQPNEKKKLLTEKKGVESSSKGDKERWELR